MGQAEERALHIQVEQLQNTIIERDTEIAELKNRALSEYSTYLIRAIDRVLPFIGYSIANLPPAENHGCPAEAFLAFLDDLDLVVAIDKRYRAVLGDWRVYGKQSLAIEGEHTKKKLKAPRAKPASRAQLLKMAQDFDKEFGEGSIKKRVETLLGNK